jgi:Na+/proline symporter
MFDNNGNGWNGSVWVILFFLTLGIIFVPLLCANTLLRDGWEDTPEWMRYVGAATLICFAFLVVAGLLSGIH